MSFNSPLDVIIVGAGPCGLSVALEAKKHGLSYLVLEKGNITEAIRKYPSNMTFFSTSEMIEIGAETFPTVGMRPNRQEALKYYRRVVEKHGLKVEKFCEVQKIKKSKNLFDVATSRGNFQSKFVVIATGYYDLPRFINVPGENLPHVSHYYDEAYKYFQQKVVVVGGANSAVETALDLYRNGADVTLVHIFPSLDKSAKYWIAPDLENRIKKEEVKAYFEHQVVSIEKHEIRIAHIPSKKITSLPADFVFLMTGYRPNATRLQEIGISLQGEAMIPTIHPETFESNVEGIYLAGSIIGGEETAKVFIENGRWHGIPIIQDIMKKL